MNIRTPTSIALLAAAILAGCASSTTGLPSGSAAGRVLPVDENPIVNTSTTESLEITAAAVEDNEDPATNAPISDRLQLTLANTGQEVLTGFEIYYEMTDATTGSTEGYYQRLDGLEIAPGEDATIFFDNETGPGHYPENEFSLYRSSVNQVDFAIQVSAVGAKIATATAMKEAGTGEEAD
jgi:hypothetical protein